MTTPIIALAPRMLATLDRLRTIGWMGTGVSRPAFPDADIAARRWLAERMREAGLEVRVDPAGNLCGLPPGDEPAILAGFSRPAAGSTACSAWRRGAGSDWAADRCLRLRGRGGAVRRPCGHGARTRHAT